jgi:peptidyl-prolyl cis-trans isomerase C
MTPLDSALRVAQQDPSRQNEFYSLFLNTELLVPIYEAQGIGSAPRRATGNEKFTPVILEANGKRYLPVFDTEERLVTWAKRKIQYLGIPAHALMESLDDSIMESLDDSIHWVLNVGTEYFKEFVSDEIKWLKSQMQSEAPQTHVHQKGTEIMIGQPAKTPSILIERLRRIFTLRNEEVKAAYLAQMMVQQPKEKPYLLLVIKMEPFSETVFQNIMKEVGIAAKGALGPAEILDMIPFKGGQIDSDIAKTIPPFFTR